MQLNPSQGFFRISPNMGTKKNSVFRMYYRLNDLNFREPTHQNDLIENFQPVNSNENQFLDIANEGLKIVINPKQSAMELWTQLAKQAVP